MSIALGLLALTFLPGLPLGVLVLRRTRSGIGWIALAGSVGVLWTLLMSFGLTSARIPLNPPVLLTLGAIPLAVLLLRSPRHHARILAEKLRMPASEALVGVLTTLLLAVPLVTVQQGLPTGDVQKSIFWAQRILRDRRLPNYQEALRLNRDPTDFATPGLHALTASVIALTGDAYRGPAWFSLLGALLLAGTAAALATLLAPAHQLLPILAFLFAATNERFLRYTTAPGYHYQNLIGELLLATSLFFLLQTVGGRGGLRYLAFSGAFATQLPFVHQFTAFLALFILPLVFLTILISYRAEVATLLTQMPPTRRKILAAVLIGIAGVTVLLAYRFGVHKVADLFSHTPHLAPYVVPLASVPTLLGEPFTFLGIAGLLVTLVGLTRRDLEWRWSLVILWAVIVAGLSQGPRWVIDIPSARTLFYIVVPFSLFGSLVVARGLDRMRALWPRSAPLLAPLTLALVLAPTAGSAPNSALQGITHAHQANSTLTNDMLDLIEYLQSHPPQCAGDAGSSKLESRQSPSVVPDSAPVPCADAVLIDDWNRRRTTWVLLSPHRLLTRVGADLAVIARESTQSDQRRRQYENLLDFEKVYALGNSSVIAPLLAKHGVHSVVGANGLSDDVFAQNPALEAVYRNSEVTLFHVREEGSTPRPLTSQEEDEDAGFLLDPLTLANDIGDAEDIFAHLPLSVLAPRISAPQIVENRTVRTIESAVSSIGLNIGAYLPRLLPYGPESAIDRRVELRLVALGNGAQGRVTRGTTVFSTFALPSDGRPHTIRVRIPPRQLVLDEQGLTYLTLRLDSGPLRLDMMAAQFLPSQRE